MPARRILSVTGSARRHCPALSMSIPLSINKGHRDRVSQKAKRKTFCFFLDVPADEHLHKPHDGHSKSDHHKDKIYSSDLTGHFAYSRNDSTGSEHHNMLFYKTSITQALQKMNPKMVPGTKISHSGHRPKPEVRNQCPDAPAHKDRAEKAGEHDDELEISVLLSPLAPHYLYINEKPEEDGSNVYKYPDRIYFISHLIISCSKKHKP